MPSRLASDRRWRRGWASMSTQDLRFGARLVVAGVRIPVRAGDAGGVALGTGTSGNGEDRDARAGVALDRPERAADWARHRRAAPLCRVDGDDLQVEAGAVGDLDVGRVVEAVVGDNVSPAGSGSETTTFAAVFGPWLVTFSVYVSSVPGVAGSGAAVFSTHKLARCAYLQCPESVAAGGKASLDPGDQVIALGPGESVRKVLHHHRIGIQPRERRMVGLTPTSQQQPGGFQLAWARHRTMSTTRRGTLAESRWLRSGHPKAIGHDRGFVGS